MNLPKTERLWKCVITVCIFKIDAAIRNAFPKCVCGATLQQTRRLFPKIGRLLLRIGKFFPKNRKASSENRKVFSEESERFFRRALGLYTYKFPKRGAASLMYHLRSCLGLSRNSNPATEGFSNRGINFQDVYRSW